jgi:cell division transport system permease protein
MRHRLRDFFLRHMQASVNSLGHLSRSPMASIMTCFVIGITLALPTALFVMLKNAENISHHFQQTMQLTLYLKKNVTESQALALTKTLKKQFGIDEISSISPAQGLKELQEQEGFEGLISTMSDNPLPWAIVILPSGNFNSPDALESLTQQLKQRPEVESLQLDLTWVKRLETLIDLAHRTIYALAIFLGFAVLLIINNAVRSATHNNQKEIEIIKLIGGTPTYIRRPFLYAGIIYGLMGGIIAWQLVDIFLLILKSPVSRLATLYDTSYQLIGIGLNDTLLLLGISIFLGLTGAWLAVTRHLRSC